MHLNDFVEIEAVIVPPVCSLASAVNSSFLQATVVSSSKAVG